MDWEGNEYKTRNYGGTWWMVENLRTTRTRDGQNIWVSSEEDKYSYTTPYCYFHDDNEKKLKKEGCLYNWTAANQVCPEGWRLPTIADYEALAKFVGSVEKNCYNGNSNAIAQSMASTDGWEYNSHPGTPGYTYLSFSGNVSNNNESGFGAPPVGWYTPFRDSHYDYYGSAALYWLSEEYDPNIANVFYIFYNNTKVIRDTFDKPLGLSVRCVKD